MVTFQYNRYNFSKMKTIPLIISTLSCFFTAYTLASSSVKVTVYFEALCPDSKAFIQNQLYPTKELLGNALVSEFIPYGIATTEIDDEGKYNFTCQHGPDECYVNKVHSCVLVLYPTDAFDYIYCVESNDDTASNSTLTECTASTGIAWNIVESCANSAFGDALLAANGVDTVTAQIVSMPTVTVNDRLDDVANTTLQNTAASDFISLACEFLEEGTPGC